MRNNWIFQLKYPLTSTQKDKISREIAAFLASWKAHGTPVPGSADIRYDHFVVLQADPGTTSGCSIDSMTREIARILDQNEIERMESNFIFYQTAGGEIRFVDFREVETLIASGDITADTLVFDNTLGQENNLDLWEVPLKQTWLSRFLKVLS